jgi:hypothetical protein
MGEEVDWMSMLVDAFLGFRIDKAEAFGVVEPLDLALYSSPSAANNSITGVSSSSSRRNHEIWLTAGPLLPTVGSIGCNTVLPIVKVTGGAVEIATSASITVIDQKTNLSFHACNQPDSTNIPIRIARL